MDILFIFNLIYSLYALDRSLGSGVSLSRQLNEGFLFIIIPGYIHVYINHCEVIFV